MIGLYAGIKTLVGHSGNVFDCDIQQNINLDSPDVMIVSCGVDGTVRFWACAGPDGPLKIIRDHFEAVYKCSFSPDGKRVVSCGEDQSVRLFSVPEGYQLFCYLGHVSPVTTVKFSPSSRFLVSGSDYGERKIIVWRADMPDAEEVPIQLPHMIYWTPVKLYIYCLF